MEKLIRRLNEAVAELQRLRNEAEYKERIVMIDGVSEKDLQEMLEKARNPNTSEEEIKRIVERVEEIAKKAAEQMGY